MNAVLNIRICFIVFMLLSCEVNAQIAPAIIKKYPVSTLNRLQFVVERVDLPVDKQEELAQYYNKQNNLAELKRMQGATMEEISKYTSFDQIQLAKILTPIQQIEFKIANSDYGVSEIEKAIKYRRELGLTAPQLNALLAEAESVKTPSQTRKSEYDHLQRILNKEQFQNYFIVINQNSAARNSLSQWQQLKKYGLGQTSDSLQIIKEINQYTRNKLVNIDKANCYRPGNTDSVIQFYELNKPYILWKLDVYQNTLPWWIWGQVGRIIINRDKLKLTEQQIDSLLLNDIHSEQKKWNTPFRYSNEFVAVWQEELASVTRILTEEQYRQYLEIKNYHHSLYNADMDWYEIKKAGLITAQTDSTKEIQESQDYELKLLIANEIYYNNKTQKNLFSKQEVENNKPEILKKLEAINEKEAADKRSKSSLSW